MNERARVLNLMFLKKLDEPGSKVEAQGKDWLTERLRAIPGSHSLEVEDMKLWKEDDQIKFRLQLRVDGNEVVHEKIWSELEMVGADLPFTGLIENQLRLAIQAARGKTSDT